MFKKILIANRGEIAVRIVRACRDLGIEAIVAFSEADRDSLAVRLADRSVCLGPWQAAASYLNRDAILAAATALGCDAVHPGYGFLAENAGFSAACAAEGIAFIGPGPDAIAAMGNKVEARRLAAWFDGKFDHEVTRNLFGEKYLRRVARRGTPDPAAIRTGYQALRYHMDYIGWLGSVGQRLLTVDEATRARVIQTVRAAFAPFVHCDTVRYTAACWQIDARAGD